VDQALFSTGYRDLEGWAAERAATFIAPLGISAHMTLGFVGGHVMASFAAPIALAEGLRRSRHLEPWIGRAGLVFTALGYAAAAWLVYADHQATQSSHASGAQIAGAAAAVVALIGCAFAFGRRPCPVSAGRTPPAILLGVASFAASMVWTPATWLGTGIAAAALAAVGAWALRASRTAGWEPRHEVALAAGVLFSRALLAFTYFPLFGSVSPARKYAHNVVMLAIVAAATWRAWRNGTRAAAGA
jgi:hypothetical protein